MDFNCCQKRRLEAGQKHCGGEWEVGAKLWPNCPIASIFQRQSIAGSRMRSWPFPSCQDEFSWLFQRKALILQAEGWSTGCWRGSARCASPVHPGQCCIYGAAERHSACWALDRVQHWGVNAAVQTAFVCFLYSLADRSAAVLCAESSFPIYLRGMFSFIVAWWSVWLRQNENLLSALGLTSLKKEEMYWKK